MSPLEVSEEPDGTLDWGCDEPETAPAVTGVIELTTPVGTAGDVGGGAGGFVTEEAARADPATADPARTTRTAGRSVAAPTVGAATTTTTCRGGRASGGAAAAACFTVRWRERRCPCWVEGVTEAWMTSGWTRPLEFGGIGSP